MSMNRTRCLGPEMLGIDACMEIKCCAIMGIPDGMWMADFANHLSTLSLKFG